MEPLLSMPSLKVLAAVSGGMDSMCLAGLLHREGADFGIAHCNFSLRGEESDADELLVKTWAEERGIPFHGVRFDTAAWAKEHGVSIEMAARSLRYSFFAETARKEGYEAVAVAHHADDNAETLILNLLRGSGSRGLSGMKETGVLPVTGAEDIPLLRPLLSWTREDIKEWVLQSGIPYREDRTNSEDTFRRNRIRNRVFPVFREINPSFVRTLNEDCSRIAETDSIADDYFHEAKPRVCSPDGSILTDALKEEKHRSYILFRLLEELGFQPSISEEISDRLESSLLRSGSTWNSPDYTLTAASGRLVVSRRMEETPIPESIIISGPGEYSFMGKTLTVGRLLREEAGQLKRKDGSVSWDEDRLPFPLTLRPWQDGDYFAPFGMRGVKKLQDWFSDRHWSIPEKKSAILVVLKGSRIAAILGETIDHSLRITSATKTIIRISF